MDRVFRRLRVMPLCFVHSSNEAKCHMYATTIPNHHRNLSYNHKKSIVDNSTEIRAGGCSRLVHNSTEHNTRVLREYSSEHVQLRG